MTIEFQLSEVGALGTALRDLSVMACDFLAHVAGHVVNDNVAPLVPAKDTHFVLRSLARGG